MDVTPDGFQLVSGLVRVELNFKCSVLLGVNIANKLLERFSGATVGFNPGAESTGCQPCGQLKSVKAISAFAICASAE